MYRIIMTAGALAVAALATTTAAQAQSWGVWMGSQPHYGYRGGNWGGGDWAMRSVCSGDQETVSPLWAPRAVSLTKAPPAAEPTHRRLSAVATSSHFPSVDHFGAPAFAGRPVTFTFAPPGVAADSTTKLTEPSGSATS